MENNKCEDCEHFNQCEITLIVHNPVVIDKEQIDYFNDGYKINKGDKIAQIMLCEHKTYLMGYDTQEKRTGGFGSTGN